MIEVFTHCVAVEQNGEFVHFVGYPGEPTIHDLKSLREELITDFGLIEFEFHTGTQAMVDMINEIASEMED